MGNEPNPNLLEKIDANMEAVNAEPPLAPNPMVEHQLFWKRIYNEPELHQAFMYGKQANEYEGVEGAVKYILHQLGLNGEHFDDTPRRVAALLRSFRHGSEATLGEVLKVGFEETEDNILVAQTEIPFKGLCAHHLLPFFGTATVGYIPRKRVVGLSKLTRLVQAAGSIAPTTQEHITNLVADTLFRTMEPIAAGCVTRALHGCMAVRGVHAPSTYTTVSALRGQFLMNPQAREEFLALTRNGHG